MCPVPHAQVIILIDRLIQDCKVIPSVLLSCQAIIVREYQCTLMQSMMSDNLEVWPGGPTHVRTI